MTRRASLNTVTLVLAVTCGATVANLYYCQPLLPLLSRSFGVGQGAASFIVTLTQLGYATGLLFVLPLGDLLETGRFASRALLATALALVVAASAPNYPIFAAISVLIGVTSVVAQILVPYVTHLAPPEQRGRYVGRVMSGLLSGILLGRTIASLVAAAWGWRSIYLLSAGIMLVLALVLHRMLPEHRPEERQSYGALLRSVGHYMRTQPALRRRAATQAMLFALFSCFWTAIAFELTDHHGFSQTQIGLFALVGAAGAFAAPVAGRLGDRGHTRAGSGGAVLLCLAGTVIALIGSSQVLLLGLAAVVMDLGVQAHLILAQHEVYALVPEARSRLNSAFTSSFFLGGAAGSAVTGTLYEHYGWDGPMLFAIALAVVALAIWGRWILTTRTALVSSTPAQG